MTNKRSITVDRKEGLQYREKIHRYMEHTNEINHHQKHLYGPLNSSFEGVFRRSTRPSMLHFVSFQTRQLISNCS